MTHARVLPHLRPAVAWPVVAVLMLAGCSSGAAGAAGAIDGGNATPEVAADAPGAGVPGGAPRDGGGVSGLIASVSDPVMQVQATDSQTAITWTDETVITRSTTVALDRVAVGSCVVAITAATAAATGTADAATGPATTVAISEPVDGECAAGFGRGGAGRPEAGGMPTDLPTDVPTDRPTQVPAGGRPSEGFVPPDGAQGQAVPGGFGGITVGLVTAVSGTAITVETAGDGATTTETIEVDADTTYTATVVADASAIAVGLCASAQGETDTRGGMTAATLVLSDADQDGCPLGADLAVQAPGVGGSDG